MSVPFTNLPRSATIQLTPFKVSIPQSALDELKSLVRLSKLAPPTYEGSQEDRKYGVTNKWVRETKEKWEKDFDWYVYPILIRPNAFSSSYNCTGVSMKPTSIRFHITWPLLLTTMAKNTRFILSASSPTKLMLYRSFCFTDGQVYARSL